MAYVGSSNFLGGDPYSGLGPKKETPEEEQARRFAEGKTPVDRSKMLGGAGATAPPPATLPTSVLEREGVRPGAPPVYNREQENALAQAKALAAAEEAKSKFLYTDPSYGSAAGAVAPYTKLLEDERIRAAGLQAPQVIGAGKKVTESAPFYAAQSQFGVGRGEVTGALELQRQAALGQAPSVAESQLAQGRDMAIQNAMALGASARGSASQRLAAERGAMAQEGAAMNQYAQQAAQLRAGEMATARAQYSSAAEAARAGDTQYSDMMLRAQAGDRDAMNQVAFNNLQAKLATQQLTEQERFQYEQLKQQIISAQMNQSQSAAALYSGREQFADDLALRKYAAEKGFQLADRQADAASGGMIGSAIGTVAGGVGGFFLGGPAGAMGGAAAGGGLGNRIGSYLGGLQ